MPEPDSRMITNGTPKRLGLISLLVGVMAIVTAATATYARSVHIPGSGAVLKWLAEMGFVKEHPAGESSIAEASLFSVNDENALVLLAGLAIFLAAAALVIALVAEYRREPTLYLSAGYVCGALALTLFKPLAGLVAMAAGVAAVLVLRQGRRERDS